MLCKGIQDLSKVVYDLETGDKNGSEITFAQLMQEAVKFGADDIINVRIDKTGINEVEDYYNKNSINDKEIFAGRKQFEKKIIYNATALAIKYTNAITCSQVQAVNKPQEKNEDAKAKVQQNAQQAQQVVSSAAVVKLQVRKRAINNKTQ